MDVDPTWTADLLADVRKAISDHQKHGQDINKWWNTLHSVFGNRLAELAQAANIALSPTGFGCHVEWPEASGLGSRVTVHFVRMGSLDKVTRLKDLTFKLLDGGQCSVGTFGDETKILDLESKSSIDELPPIFAEHVGRVVRAWLGSPR